MKIKIKYYLCLKDKTADTLYLLVWSIVNIEIHHLKFYKKIHKLKKARTLNGYLTNVSQTEI